MDNIYYNRLTRKHSFYSVQYKAWHHKGQIADKHERSGRVIIQSGLNFTVEKMAHVEMYPSGKYEDSDSSFFTYRSDTEERLGAHVGPDYTIVQNAEAFAFFDEIAGKDGIYYETAGALGRGERIFITAKLPNYIKVGGKDMIEQYLFLTNYHDGKGSITAAFTPIRIVCNNTLNAALKNCTNVVRIRHTPSAHDRLKEAHKVMGMVNTAAPIIEQAFNHLASIKITDREVKKLIEMAMAPDKETLAHIKAGEWEEVGSCTRNRIVDTYNYYMGAESQQLDTTKGTLFGVYNAITGYHQNVCKYKTDEDKIASLIYGGTGQQKGQRAYDLIADYASYGADLFNS